MERAIARLVHKLIEPAGSVKVEKRGLFGPEEWSIDVYRSIYDSLVIQYPDMPDAFRYTNDIVSLAPLPWRSFCRWHNGPLWRKDEPWHRLYCTVSVEGYCRQHKRSPRALYEYCMSLQGDRGLGACKMLDEIGRTEYVVYLTDGGAGRVKVGVTRRFRVYERISEQPHNIATILYTTDSAYDARMTEIRISRAGIASQHRSRKPKRVGIAEAIAAVSSAAERASKLLGVEWNGRFFRVESQLGGALYGLREARAEALQGETLRIRGYWMGRLVLEAGGSLILLRDKEILHKDSLLVDKNV